MEDYLLKAPLRSSAPRFRYDTEEKILDPDTDLEPVQVKIACFSIVTLLGLDQTQA